MGTIDTFAPGFYILALTFFFLRTIIQFYLARYKTYIYYYLPRKFQELLLFYLIIEQHFLFKVSINFIHHGCSRSLSDDYITPPLSHPENRFKTSILRDILKASLRLSENEKYFSITVSLNNYIYKFFHIYEWNYLMWFRKQRNWI